MLSSLNGFIKYFPNKVTMLSNLLLPSSNCLGVSTFPIFGRQRLLDIIALEPLNLVFAVTPYNYPESIGFFDMVALANQ